MILDYYRMFYYVAQYQSFSKAAEILNNNQPNLSLCMNMLEQELGCKLFLRSNKGVSLTPEGARLYKHVAIAVEQLAIGENEILKDKTMERGLINIGASETALRLFLLGQLEAFHKAYPRVRLRISNHSTPQAVSALANGIVDFAVVTTPVKIKKPLHKISLYRFQEILIGGLQYAQTASKVRHLDELQDIPFISLGSDTGTRKHYTHFFLDHQLPFSPDTEVASTDQILPMVKHNLGIGFYPEELASEALLKHEIVSIPLFETIPEREIYLIHDHRRPASIASQKLMEMLCTTS